MANTYSKLYYQVIFAVKYKDSLIQPEWEGNLYRTIGHLINQNGCKTIIVNGYVNHVHCFFIGKPSLSISEMMKSIKSKSSKWVNEQNFIDAHFAWQRGFGCFSYSHSQQQAVYKYIQNQKQHHQKTSFRKEYINLLNGFDVDFDETYIFEDPK